MDPLALARRRQEYETRMAAQAAQKDAREAEEATKVKKQWQDAIRQKIEALAQKRSRYTHFDWAATKLVGFFRKRIQLCPRSTESVVNVFGFSYLFSVATKLYDDEEAPFDTQEARLVFDAALRNQQNCVFFGSRDRRLSPDEVALFLLACLCKRNQPDVGLLFGIFDDSTIAHLYSLNLHDHTDLSRAIRLLNLLQNQGIPPPIFENFPTGTNLDEITITLIQDIQFQLEEIGKSQARLEETFLRPNPYDEVQCTNCQESYLARNMHSAPRGSFLYCTACAPLAGIFPQGFFPDDGEI